MAAPAQMPDAGVGLDGVAGVGGLCRVVAGQAAGQVCPACGYVARPPKDMEAPSCGCWAVLQHQAGGHRPATMHASFVQPDSFRQAQAPHR